MEKLEKSRKSFKVLSVFIPEELYQTLDLFEKLLKEDKKIQESIQRNAIKNKNKLLSEGIRRLIKSYVDNRVEKYEHVTS